MVTIVDITDKEVKERDPAPGSDSDNEEAEIHAENDPSDKPLQRSYTLCLRSTLGGIEALDLGVIFTFHASEALKTVFDTTPAKAATFIPAGVLMAAQAKLTWVEVCHEKGKNRERITEAVIQTLTAPAANIAVMGALKHISLPPKCPEALFAGVTGLAAGYDLVKLIKAVWHNTPDKWEHAFSTTARFSTFAAVSFVMLAPVEGKEKIAIAAAVMNYLAGLHVFDKLADYPVASRISNFVGSLFHCRKNSREKQEHLLKQSPSVYSVS